MTLTGQALPHHPAPWQAASPPPRPRDSPAAMLKVSGIALVAAQPVWILVSLIFRIPALRAITPALGMAINALIPLGLLGILASAPTILLRRTPPDSDPRGIARLRTLAVVLLSIAVALIGLFAFVIYLFLSQPLTF